jgi:hypothetical protein
MPDNSKVVSWMLRAGGVAIGLAAFWFLLGYCYSPETFQARPTLLNDLEYAWFAVALAAGVVAIRVDLGAALLPAAAWGAVVVTKIALGRTLNTFDMMAFCVATGWGSAIALRHRRSTAVFESRLLPSIVLAATFVLALYQFWQSAKYLNDLALGYADCGEHARKMFNCWANPRELFLRANPDKPLFYDHFEPGFLPFVLFWPLWPGLKLTIALQVASVFGVAVPLYWIGRRVLRDRPGAWLLVGAWLVHPSTGLFVYSSSYGFRWGNVCLPMYFSALALWLHGRRGWALAVACWAMLIKEEAMIVTGMFGLYLVLFDRRRRMGVGVAALAFGAFFVTTSWVIPAIAGSASPIERFYRDFGDTRWQVLFSPLTKPGLFWGRLLDKSSFYFGAALIGPLLLLPLRKPSILFVGGLTFVFCCLNPIMKNISFHYQAALLPVVFWAAVSALEGKTVEYQRSALAGMIVAGVLFSMFFGGQPWSKPMLAARPMPGRLELVRKFGRQIERSGTLVTTQRVGAHFITQRYLYVGSSPPSQTDYALIDLRDSWRGSLADAGWLERLRHLQHEVEANPNLHLLAAEDGLLFFGRSGAELDARQQVEMSSLPTDFTPARAELGHGVIVVAYQTEVLQSEDGEQLRVRTYSTVTEPTNVDLAVRCHVATKQPAEQYATDYQPLGQGIWPVSRWQTNRYYLDEFFVPVPRGVGREVSPVGFDTAVLHRPVHQQRTEHD